MSEGKSQLTKTYTFDTGPLFLYFGDPRVKKVLDEIRGHDGKGSTCETDLAELHYATCEQFGRETARLRYVSARRITGVEVILTTICRFPRQSSNADIWGNFH